MNFKPGSLQGQCLVMGNGPSAKLLNLKKVKEARVPFVGMNSAFRLWKQIDVYPTYYSAIDETVTKSIAREIVDLIEKSPISAYLLHDGILESYPKIQDSGKILLLSETLTGRAKYFDPNSPVTTGAWSIRWMANNGFTTISVIGLDGIRQEIIPEAAPNQEGQIELDIKSTPQYNPNYFFQGYQAEGDKFRIPNLPSHTRNHGIRLHDHAYLNASEDLLCSGIKLFELSVDNLNGINRKLSTLLWPISNSHQEIQYIKSVKEALKSSGFEASLRSLYPHILGSFELDNAKGFFYVGSPKENRAKGNLVSTGLIKQIQSNNTFKAFTFVGQDLLNRRNSGDLSFLLSNSIENLNWIEWEPSEPGNIDFCEFISNLRVDNGLKSRLLDYEFQIYANYASSSAEYISRLKLAIKDLIVAITPASSLVATPSALLRQTSKLTSTTSKGGNSITANALPRLSETNSVDSVFLHINHRFLDVQQASISIYIKSRFPSRIKVKICRDGSRTPYEQGTLSVFDICTGLQVIRAKVSYSHRHSGTRLELSGNKSCHELDNITILGIQAVFGTTRGPAIIRYKTYRAPQDPSKYCTESSMIDINLISIESDMKNMQGHFYRYNQNLLEVANGAGIDFKILGRKDIEDETSEKLSCVIHKSFTRHSWTISSNRDIFSRELEEISSLLNPCTVNIAYMYTGSIYHALCMNEIAKKLKNKVYFVCNLFWEMIKDVQSDSYSQAFEELRQLYSRSDLKIELTSPTDYVQQLIFEKTGIKTCIAPHPSTGCSDSRALELLKKRAKDDDRSIKQSKRAKVFFPGVNTVHKGYDFGLSLAKKLSENGYEVVVRPDHERAPVAKLNYLELGVTEEAFDKSISSSDLIVLPYMPEGFQNRTSGIVTDALYYNIPAAVIEGTWLEQFVSTYNSGFSIQPEIDIATKTIAEFLKQKELGSCGSDSLAYKYFSENSWTSLVSSIVELVFESTRIKNLELNTASGEIQSLLDEGKNIFALYYANIISRIRPSEATRLLRINTLNTILLDK